MNDKIPMKNRDLDNLVRSEVMRRIYQMWFMRYLRTSRTIRVVALVAVVFLSRIWVSFPDVLHNARLAPGKFFSVLEYLAKAILQTEVTVQAIVILGALLTGLFVIDIGKLVRRTLTPAGK